MAATSCMTLSTAHAASPQSSHELSSCACEMPTARGLVHPIGTALQQEPARRCCQVGDRRLMAIGRTAVGSRGAISPASRQTAKARSRTARYHYKRRTVELLWKGARGEIRGALRTPLTRGRSLRADRGYDRVSEPARPASRPPSAVRNSCGILTYRVVRRAGPAARASAAASRGRRRGRSGPRRRRRTRRRAGRPARRRRSAAAAVPCRG